MKLISRASLNRILLFPIIALLVYFVFASVGKGWEAYRLQEEEGRLNREIEDLKAYNGILQKQKEYFQSETAIEYGARQTGLIKPGETAVIIVTPVEPEPIVEETPKGKEQKQDQRSNWQRWWDLLFGEREGG